ncbi:PSD1 and planctomycete cytochrome C domain-containing protein [Roseibacillus persicicus]|uniref:PSD1 and planctomycete cytochrome C domain-containing protein n=1 Tax=Roseibacillus persicicus TaxID=454148 RepID=UPI00280EA899|nr:PSD1 and planctomycete cytochrome C domain-containing protein [Roseibacillus persicicus]MDQ8188735.1 PSD1 and planctomycete cytochrome C domain-containing protein [Roseibacillus persicicus]
MNSFSLPLILLLSLSLGRAVAADGQLRFNEDVRPLLSKKCIACHGPDADKGRKGDLRLDIPDGDQGAYRVLDGVQAIKPGDLANSEVWQRIIADDPDDIMPPPEKKSHIKPLTSEEKDVLKRWIEQGAEYEDFWAFVPPRQHELPEVSLPDWSGDPIDRFALAKMEEKGLSPSERADRRSLIRRVSLDLTGLPPTLDEVDAFLHDESADAYEKLVDRLLGQASYGEHMAKYWLDLVRFADTNGAHHDHFRDLTPYRDWVIRSFNENLSYDEFVKYQVAGDLYENPTTDQLIASGFNRLHIIIDVGTALPEESFTKNVIDRVSAVGTAFMGLTLQCAVCHDHKYDPISQKDFFSMYAFFNNFDGEPETGRRGTPDFKKGLQPPYILVGTPEQEARLAELELSISASSGEVRSSLEAERQALQNSMRGAMVMKEREDPRPSHVLIRGAYDNPGEIVPRDTPSFLPPLKKDDHVDRMDLAEWLVDPVNPLSARVAVNRFWQQFFGVGIVKTSEDFGAQGEWPSHPELLDHLALEFVESGWDIKSLVRSIVLSETYQQRSEAPREAFVSDPENRMLARGSRFRLDSEVIRDQVLAVSGLLNPAMYGHSVKFPQPEGLWKIVTMPSSFPRNFEPAKGDEVYRRSVYSFWKRGLPPPQMTIFDAPNRDACIARRERTNTPLQALVMMNETEYFAAAKHLARGVMAKENMAEDLKVSLLYETMTSRPPSDTEKERLLSALAKFRALYQDDPDSAAAMFPNTPAAGESAAWTMLVHSLMNLDTFKNRE